MNRIGNISFYINNNQICIAEHVNINSEQINDCCFLDIKNIGIEIGSNKISFHIYKESSNEHYHLKTNSHETAKKVLTALFSEIHQNRE